MMLQRFVFRETVARKWLLYIFVNYKIYNSHFYKWLDFFFVQGLASSDGLQGCDTSCSIEVVTNKSCSMTLKSADISNFRTGQPLNKEEIQPFVEFKVAVIYFVLHTAFRSGRETT